MPEFSIIEVSGNSAESVEQLGTKLKFWFRDQELGRCLCKLTRPSTGEDWSEKIAAEIAGAMGLPHAAYELGSHEGQRCVVSPMFLPDGCSLIHGNELLGETDPSYGTGARISRYRQSAHTLEAVWDALHQTASELPRNWSPPAGITTAVDVFVGYLVLDAFIGNTDRHDENWAIIEAPEHPTARRHLAPTFDHASSLGCHLQDVERERRLQTRDAGYTVEAYASAFGILREQNRDPSHDDFRGVYTGSALSACSDRGVDRSHQALNAQHPRFDGATARISLHERIT